MKIGEIEVLEKALSVIEEKLPQEAELIHNFQTVLDVMVERYNNQYRNKADYYRVAVRDWDKRNPEKVKEYQKRYQEKKQRQRREKISLMSKQGKTVSEIANELKISERTVKICLNEIMDCQTLKTAVSE